MQLRHPEKTCQTGTFVTVQILTWRRANGEWQPRNDHPQASVLNERKPQAQCEFRYRYAEDERERVISGAIAYAWL